jgi:hypothetical protein
MLEHKLDAAFGVRPSQIIQEMIDKGIILEKDLTMAAREIEKAYAGKEVTKNEIDIVLKRFGVEPTPENYKHLAIAFEYEPMAKPFIAWYKKTYGEIKD